MNAPRTNLCIVVSSSSKEQIRGCIYGTTWYGPAQNLRCLHIHDVEWFVFLRKNKQLLPIRFWEQLCSSSGERMDLQRQLRNWSAPTRYYVQEPYFFVKNRTLWNHQYSLRRFAQREASNAEKWRIARCTHH